MASIKKLKKQITYLTEEVISNCYLASMFQGEKAVEPLQKIISEAAELHNKFRGAALKCPKDVCSKKYYAQLTKDFASATDELFSKISEVCKK